MKAVIIRVIRLFIGLFLYSVGIVLTINANLGLAPWDVFHQGLSNIFNITIGLASIIVGIVLVLLNSLLGERLGWGTILNMLFIGIFIDIIMLNNLIPVSQSIFSGLIMLAAGMFIIGVGSYFYLGAELGSGPRDGLMIAFTKKTGKTVSFIRNTIETGVFAVGYFLGGHIGPGTLIVALTIGFFIQLAFKLFNFDVSMVEHRFIDQDFFDFLQG